MLEKDNENTTKSNSGKRFLKCDRLNKYCRYTAVKFHSKGCENILYFAKKNILLNLKSTGKEREYSFYFKKNKIAVVRSTTQ